MGKFQDYLVHSFFLSKDGVIFSFFSIEQEDLIWVKCQKPHGEGFAPKSDKFSCVKVNCKMPDILKETFPSMVACKNWCESFFCETKAPYLREEISSEFKSLSASK